MTSREAWFCPSCQKHHAPHCDTCPGIAGAEPAPAPPGLQVPAMPRSWELRPTDTPWTPYFEPTTCGVTVVPDPNLIMVN